MKQALLELRARLREINDVESAAAVLEWDQSTYMPAGGAEARARHISTLGRVAHDMRRSSALGELIDRLRGHGESLPPGNPDGALIRVARREHERATRVPSELVAAIKGHVAECFVTWTRARANDDFKTMRPLLEKTLELTRRYSACFTEHDHPADPLIDLYDRGMTTESVRALFAELRKELVPLASAIAERPLPDDSMLRGDFSRDDEMELGREMAGRLGYDFARGRLDLTHHPFMTRFSRGDVRITTRPSKDKLGEAFFATVHESGHALYEQGVDPELDGLPLGGGVSAGVHESQSRLWENLVGRGRPFWQHMYPELQRRFPALLGGCSLDDFYHAINRVERSLVRVDADEITYNLHVMVRFDLETQMLEGTLSIADLPDAWNDRYEQDLGVRPPDDRVGVLQDVHWYVEKIGGLFQGYTLGNVMSAQFFAAANRARPDIPDRIAEGDFKPLRDWLTENIYRHGGVYDPLDLVTRATGSPLRIEPYMEYLRSKFGELYRI